MGGQRAAAAGGETCRPTSSSSQSWTDLPPDHSISSSRGGGSSGGKLIRSRAVASLHHGAASVRGRGRLVRDLSNSWSKSDAPAALGREMNVAGKQQPELIERPASLLLPTWVSNAFCSLLSANTARCACVCVAVSRRRCCCCLAEFAPNLLSQARAAADLQVEL